VAEEELIPVRSYEVFGSSETPIYGQSPGDPTTRHADLIGTAAATSTDDGQSLTYEYPVYTAFGELAGGNPGDGRYGYAGEWGYETGLLVLAGASGTAPITLQHLGARWYDPALGRFIQRDPIGIAGGRNVYEYVRSSPTEGVDPYGLLGFWDIVDGNTIVHKWIADNFWTPLLGQKRLAEMDDAEYHRWQAITVLVCIAVGVAASTAVPANFADKIGFHNPATGAHAFPHIQYNWWLRGVKGSGGAWRLPLWWN